MKISTKYILSISGIYAIKNNINNNLYIGQSRNIYRRGIYHRFALNNNIHSNRHLQNAVNKYGIENFSFCVIEYCDKNILTEKEKFYISIEKNKVYNIKESSDSIIKNNRLPVTDEQRLKMSNAKKGKIPKNIKEFRQARKRKVAYYIDDKLIKIFNSCIEASNFFKVDYRLFNYFIGKKRTQKSKYFAKNIKIEYL